MTVVLAVLAVGVGSLAFRLGPLLTAELLPARATQLAGWAGLSVLAAITLRTVLRHTDAAVPAAPAVAAAAVGVALVLAHRGRPLLLAVSAGAATYLLLAPLVGAL